MEANGNVSTQCPVADGEITTECLGRQLGVTRHQSPGTGYSLPTRHKLFQMKTREVRPIMY